MNAVAPGLTFTPFVRPGWEAAPEAWRKRQLAQIPLRRGAEAEEVAAAILFLASDEASYVTGVVLDVNGGRFMG